MFSSGRRDPTKKKRDLSQYGLFDVSLDINDDGGDDGDEGDSDLEAELAAISAGTHKPRKKPAKPLPIDPMDLDKMVADSLKDDDEDVSSGDEDDPNLLSELNEMIDVPVDGTTESPEEMEVEPTKVFAPTTDDAAGVIKNRIEMYKKAEENAKSCNDLTRARRFGRGLKTLNELLKKANAGKPINMDDIPPEVSVKPATVQPQTDEVDPTETLKPAPARPAPPPPIQTTEEGNTATSSDAPNETATVSNDNNSKIDALLARQREYKLAALNSKKSGDTDTALKYVRVVKMFDAVLKAAREGQEVDLSDMPPPPNEFDINLLNSLPNEATSPPDPPKEEAESQNATADPVVVRPAPAPAEPIKIPKTVLEALIQRLELYKSKEEEAKKENNSSKARRFGRIVKQYEDAIKYHKAGKPVPFDDLPNPPDYPPIPTSDNQTSEISTRPSNPVVPARPTPESSSGDSAPVVPPRRPTLQKQDSRISGNHSNTSVMNKTIAIIEDRQREFKQAALQAKKAGEINEAKEYLKTYKGLENLLNVARGGMPVDLSTLPIAPSQRANLEDSFVVISQGDVSNDDLGDISTRLEEQLQKQLTMCKTTRDHNRSLGDVAGTNRFENLALGVQKDLDFVRIAKRNNLPLPKFHYEQKSFTIVRCNTDLTESELEIEVIRGLSYGVSNPKDVDTYVKVEFPYPQETPFKAKTQVIRDTDSPVYNEKFTAEIQPKVRQCQRVFKRHAVKFEIYSKGGFFRSDTLIGTVIVKLQPLETTCEIHDSFNLMDGRKTVGGKLEAKIRIRNPILTKQMEQIDEKWLIIDS